MVTEKDSNGIAMRAIRMLNAGSSKDKTHRNGNNNVLGSTKVPWNGIQRFINTILLRTAT
jgi:hypothetical protein